MRSRLTRYIRAGDPGAYLGILALNTTTTTVFVGGGTPEAITRNATDKVGFYGVAFVSQAAYVAQVGTSAATSSGFGFTATQAAAMLAATNSILTALENVGIMAQS